MYALIYDDSDLGRPKKRIISVHKARETAEVALEKRKEKLGKKIWECNTRIIWTERKIKAGDVIVSKEFSTWRPGEKIPYGDEHADCD